LLVLFLPSESGVNSVAHCHARASEPQRLSALEIAEKAPKMPQLPSLKKPLPRAVRRNANRTFKVELSLRTALIAVTTLASVWLFIHLWPVVLVVAVALMVVGAVNPIVEWLQRHKLNRGLAIAIVFFSMLLVTAGLMALTVPRLVSQVTDLVHDLPNLQKNAANSLAASRLGASFAPSVRDAKWPELLMNLAKAGLAYSPDVITGIGYCAVSLFLGLYLVVERDRLRGAAFSLVPRTHHVRLSRVLLNLEVIVGGYLRGQVITSLMAAVFTFAVLTVMHVPSAIAIAVFAGLGDVLPYVGTLIACGPAVLAALSHSTTSAIVVLILLAAYQEFESRVIVPQLYGKVLRLPAAVTMVSLLIGGKLLGIVGALLALPIAAGLRMMVSELRVELPGERPERASERERDAEAEREFARRSAGVSATRAAGIAMEVAEEQCLRHPTDDAEAAARN
jgi:putative heme transporter